MKSPASHRFLDEYLPYWLAQASYWISRDIHHDVERTGLSMAEWRVLASLNGSAGETIGTLSRLAMLKQPTLSKLVQRLEAEKLVVRTSTGGDRRQTLVASTRKGEAKIASLIEKARQHQQDLLKPLGEEHSRELIHTLRNLVRRHEHTGLFGFSSEDDKT